MLKQCVSIHDYKKKTAGIKIEQVLYLSVEWLIAKGYQSLSNRFVKSCDTNTDVEYRDW